MQDAGTFRFPAPSVSGEVHKLRSVREVITKQHREDSFVLMKGRKICQFRGFASNSSPKSFGETIT